MGACFVCHCVLAGTAACQHCSNNPNATDIWTNTGTTSTPDYFGFFMLKPQEEKPDTHGDSLRKMTDEELAHWIDRNCDLYEWCDENAAMDEDNHCLKHDGNCWMCILDWLRQEAKEC